MTVLVETFPPDGKMRLTGTGGLVVDCLVVQPPEKTRYYQCEVQAGSWSDLKADVWLRSSHTAEVNNGGASAAHFADRNGVAGLGLASIEWFDGGTRSLITRTRIEVERNRVAVFNFHIRNAQACLVTHDIVVTLATGGG
jgi:hypothetical protein